MSSLTPERLREIEAQQSGAQFSDDEIATKVRMLMRSDLDHEAVCVMARDRIEYLSAALKQVRGERDGYAAALQSANQVVTRFGGWLDRRSLPGREKKTSDVYGAWDRVREEAKWGDPVGNPLDPAECLKARDAEIRQSILNEANSQIRNARSGGFGSGSLEMFRNWLAKQKESDRQENAE